jgi:hypothetical protein
MPFVLGNIAIGFFLAIRILRLRPGWFSILYERIWERAPLGPNDFVISADEKTSIQARRRKQPNLPPASDRPMRVQHEYFREGAWTYLAAWDVHRAKVFGRCEHKTGIAPVDRLVSEVMSQEPYKTAHRVFWIMDNFSSSSRSEGH